MFFYLSNTFMFSEKLREGQQSFRNLMSAKQLNAEKLTLVDRLVSTPHSNPRSKISKNKQLINAIISYREGRMIPFFFLLSVLNE